MSRVRTQLKKLNLSSLLGDGKASGKDDNQQVKKAQKTSSTRKKLPQVPTEEEQSVMKESIRLRSPVITDNLAAYGPFFLEYSMLAEFNHLRKQKIPGVYAIPSCENPLIWLGVIFVRMGVYQDGIFRFKLTVPKNYPDGDCPSLTFTQPVFHPVVNPVTGAVDIKRAFKSWRPNVNHLWQVLLYARRIFYKIETNDPLNKEAADLFLSNSDAFRDRIKTDVENSLKTLYEDTDENGNPREIVFTEWDPEIHEAAREKLFGDQSRSLSETNDYLPRQDTVNMMAGPSISGFSFMEPGSTVIFSKDEET